MIEIEVRELRAEESDEGMLGVAADEESVVVLQLELEGGETLSGR